MKILGENSPPSTSSSTNLKRLLWIVVQSTLFRWSPGRFHGWRRMLLRVFGATIENSNRHPPRIWPSVDVYYPWLLEMKEGAMIGPGSRVYNLAQVSLGRGASLSRHIHLCAGSHDLSRWDLPLTTAAIVIEDNAWIATDVFIGPGVTIGAEAVIGARAVVIRSMPAGMMGWGNPCRAQKPRPNLK